MTQGRRKAGPVPVRSAWANGSFYLFVFLSVMAALGVLAQSVSFAALALILVAGAIFVPLIGALQMRQDDRLSEKSFFDLVKLVLGQLPLIGRLTPQGSFGSETHGSARTSAARKSAKTTRNAKDLHD